MKIIKKLLRIVICAAAVFVAATFIINIHICNSSSPYFVTKEQAQNDDYDCILVLGAGLKGNEPGLMLSDRLNAAAEVYKQGDKILMSGDNATVEHDEVTVMKNYIIKMGVPSSDVFKDHAGFSTYESMYRAKEIFGAKKILIITQKYHLYRAVYCARRLGLTAYGYSSEGNSYAGQSVRTLREYIARDKDYFYTLFNAKPKYLGKPISLTGNADQTE